MNVHVAGLATQLRQRLATRLARTGTLRAPRLREAVETVPRELFLGDRVYRRVSGEGGTGWEPITPVDPQWLDLAHEDRDWVTWLDDGEETAPNLITGGRPVATAAQPGLTVHMLESLRAGEGHKVLEIGTGMGYSTALLCELVGSHLVTTVEVDPNVAGRAEQALHRAGYEPTILVRDGLTGHAEGAPYDRILAKFPVRRIPSLWLEQTRRGGVLVAVLSGWLGGPALTRITLTGPDTAEGEFFSDALPYLAARPQISPPPIGELPSRDTGEQRDAQYGAEVFDDPMTRWLVQLAAPNARHVATEGPAAGHCLVDQETGSWAWLIREDDRWIVRQGGDQRLWDRVEETLTLWRRAGRPGQHVFRLRITRGEQLVFLPGLPSMRWALPK
ncbi:SAM-dependent methyltransferase [Thermobispora bispora]|uniref:Protein-L-isoaspartate O-methyltransferase n=1 Tax=Thermobispora bispora (strain ATCC 19993 / DSM 43833 / CBS 139.67 / JCM 10125 / KCTC 9307 / NBRC 14880 / R51) TaxID=469371 RepID=D6YAC1_THEBD|nr:protein-L-isoaspartate(D-aspartate) O-methyltransferase [Thermobispora bispora]MBO2473231.1 protein-L-isoaspartate(D-aspartate) O-methyltransferase [Actinomycetales bacterium]MDI9580036.1 methyltransferase [Thermobispora sp.]ADG90174.1 protein-L-isoaspartate(D-aspartate)O-methyltrans ferase [Thermobispora bispora DSM 43833]MBX6166580.1 protein-L-isoaspartate(D-aspartate) O-methyltransferase [Thermobispora bispora]QSI46612.1 protein-L-isoaspartate(D-aspartate) O-methyltransferase [Thermobisp